MDTIQDFLNNWDRKYKDLISKIDMFNPEKSKYWNAEQKKYFAKIFYHARGHFHEFLWYLGNHSNDRAVKEIVMKNISEELNGSAKSHEQLYIDFADSVEADMSQELIEQESYLPFVKEFNKDHLRWLNSHDTDEQFSAFSAYERLDNIDYIFLDNLTESLDISNKGRLFFKVHTRVEHFETTEKKLSDIWSKNQLKIIQAFDFIANHQLDMWKKLSETVFNYN